MRHLWQWICGYVCICVKGRQVNRFLNLCSRNGIFLWRITYDMDRAVRANLRLRDFYRLKPYLRKSKSKLKIVSRKGFPFWCYRHPKLKWFLCICMGMIFAGTYSLSFIWNVEIRGNAEVSSQEILECLKENQINVGLKKDEIDCDNLEMLLRKQFQQLGWVSVYLEHTKLCVEVKESLYGAIDDVPMNEGEKKNLVANKNAEIVSIVTRAGKAVVQEGQLVKKGDVLVVGENEIYDDNGMVKETLYLRADALIYGDVVYEIEIPMSEIEIVALKIADQYNDDSLLRFGSHKLSFYIELLEEKGIEILNKDISIHKNEKSICFRAKINAREQIGTSVLVEEVFENEFE